MRLRILLYFIVFISVGEISTSRHSHCMMPDIDKLVLYSLLIEDGAFDALPFESQEYKDKLKQRGVTDQDIKNMLKGYRAILNGDMTFTDDKSQKSASLWKKSYYKIKNSIICSTELKKNSQEIERLKKLQKGFSQDLALEIIAKRKFGGSKSDSTRWRVKNPQEFQRELESHIRERLEEINMRRDRLKAVCSSKGQVIR